MPSKPPKTPRLSLRSRAPKPVKRQQRSRQRQMAKAARSSQRKPRMRIVKPENSYYITTAIAYPNGAPHIGHAYEAITTDAIARFMRLDGRDVFFLTGTDEPGIKMLQTATKEQLAPQELLARNVPLFQEMMRKFNISNNDFIRTTDARHYKSSMAIWNQMQKAGDIYAAKYSGWYSVRDEAYYDESETRLDDNSQRLGPQGTPVEWVEEKSYFFRLSKYAKKLLKLYDEVPDFVMPKQRMNEVRSFVRAGLRDLSISRTTFYWGVPVPKNPRHVMYVWVDALTNYITALGYPDTNSEKFRKYWPADLHVIGKDIVRFHAVYWPAFLMSAGIDVPRRIFSHGFLFNRGEKMSKSVGNVIDPFDLANTYGVDQIRYFFLREVPFGQDGNYSHETIINRINADLANDLGNLAQRSLTMIGKQFGGVLPQPGELTFNDTNILERATRMLRFARELMQWQQLHKVLDGIWGTVADANRYFAGEAPWALAKTDPRRQGTVLYVTAEVLRQVAILTLPFMPASASKLLDLLAVPEEKRTFAYLGDENRLSPGTSLPAPTPVFPRYVEPERDAEPEETVTRAPPEATFMDHYNLLFWLRGCVADGEAFLRASSELINLLREIQKLRGAEWVNVQKRLEFARNRSDLTKYHFVTTIGSLLRHLERVGSLFPAIKPVYEKAEHLRKEGKDLRDMIEHADEYLAGGGRKRESFVRVAENITLNMPVGLQPGKADATSLIIDQNGHWLGGRLNVEKVLAEVQAILAVAEKIPQPKSKGP
jgi:methionyl-tRNA synthetase